MSCEEPDQLQDVQHRVQLARKLFTEQGEYIHSIAHYAAAQDGYADDLIHDLFLFFVAKPVPDNVLNIRGYLYKVILDKVRDLRRAQVRYDIKIKRYHQVKTKQLAALYQAGDLDENAQKILELIDKHLSKTEIMAIVLRYQNQYEIEDVAKAMKIKPRSVSRYISVGLKKIRQVLNIQNGESHEEGE